MADMTRLTKEWAAHPAINCSPDLVEVKFKTNLRRVHGHCGKRWGKWHIAYNLFSVKANLDQPQELELLVKHEVGHIKEQNHSSRFKEVLRQLGYPEDHLKKARCTTQLANYTPENKFVCLRCGYTKTTQRAMSGKMKTCDYCGTGWDTEANKMDRTRTMALFPLNIISKVKVIRSSEEVRQLRPQTRNLPWQAFAEYKRYGGELGLLCWWNATQRLDKEAEYVNN